MNMGVNKGLSRRWALGLGLGMIVCAGLGAYASRAAAGGALRTPPAAPVIATVDLEGVINGMNERKVKEEALSAKQVEYKAKVDGLNEELKSDKTKYDAEPEGPGKMAMAKAMREKVFRMEFEGQYAIKVLGEMKAEMLRELYLKINAAAKTLAKRNGYQLVMTSDESVPVNAGDPDSVLRAIALKRMLYVDPNMDITPDIVTFLNNEWMAGGGVAPAPKKKP